MHVSGLFQSLFDTCNRADKQRAQETKNVVLSHVQYIIATLPHPHKDIHSIVFDTLSSLRPGQHKGTFFCILD